MATVIQEAGCWLIESFRPNKQPFYELAAALISQLEPELGKTDKTIKAKELAESIRQHGFTADVSAILKDKPGKRLLLVVDQFEELYTGCADTEQQQFVDALLAVVESASRAVTLVLTLRADFYSYVVNYPSFGEALNKYPAQNLSLMNVEEMQAAIELPAKKMGVKLEEGLTQRILDDVKQEPGNLPLLEFALTQLWDKQSQGQLTHQAYSEIGEVAKALSNHAEGVYGKLSEQEQKQAQRIFLQLVHSQEGTKDTRWVATRGEVGEDCWGFLIQRLVDARLVVTGRNKATGAETVEVAHEALIREWERLRGWVQDDYEFNIWRGRLRTFLRQWKDANKDDGTLLRGAPLVEAEDWQQKRLAELSPDERVFIQLSLALRDREMKARQVTTIVRTVAVCLVFVVIGLMILLNRETIKVTFIVINKKHLSGKNMARLYLPKADLSGAKFQRANLERADLTNTNLSGANLQGSNLQGTYLPTADLSRANLSGANISEAFFVESKLVGANLAEAELSKTNLEKSNLLGANFEKAKLWKTFIPKANLSAANLSEANISEANLEGTNLSRANLSGANLQNAFMAKAKLQEANLYGANLYKANLSEVNLTGTNLSGANLTYVYGLTPEQVKSADNWQQAIYDEDFRKKLFSK
ncbi:MAG: pentapeptide repeat-containing protein [Coleofasciculus sp. Co-bin14]|nr:pentapeptide repeat-containing protein [Coleofasciculus sp. Co-bin14]